MKGERERRRKRRVEEGGQGKTRRVSERGEGKREIEKDGGEKVKRR